MDPYIRNKLAHFAYILGIAILIGLTVFWKPAVGFTLLVLYIALLFVDMHFFKQHLAAVYKNEHLPVSVIAAMDGKMRMAYTEYRHNRSLWTMTTGRELIHRSLEYPLGNLRLALRAKLRGKQWPPQYHPPFVYQDESTGTQITVE